MERFGCLGLCGMMSGDWGDLINYINGVVCSGLKELIQFYIDLRIIVDDISKKIGELGDKKIKLKISPGYTLDYAYICL